VKEKDGVADHNYTTDVDIDIFVAFRVICLLNHQSPKEHMLNLVPCLENITTPSPPPLTEAVSLTPWLHKMTQLVGMGLHELALSKESERRDQPSLTQALVDSDRL